MKKILFLVTIFILLLLTPKFIYAYPGQYPWDPIYLEPTQETQNRTTEQNLKNQYGISEFYTCYPCAAKDTSNPYTQSTCLSQTQYCLEKRKMAQTNGCSSGYIYFNGDCVKSEIPTDVIDKAIELLGSGRNSTPTPIPESPDVSCKKIYGQYSYFTGNFTNDGKYICDCLSNAEWNSQRTFCFQIPPAQVITPAPSPYPIFTPIPTPKPVQTKKQIVKPTIKPVLTPTPEAKLVAESVIGVQNSKAEDSKKGSKPDTVFETSKPQEDITIQKIPEQPKLGLIAKVGNFFKSIGRGIGIGIFNFFK